MRNNNFCEVVFLSVDSVMSMSSKMAKRYRKNVTEREIIDILYNDSGSEGDLSEDFDSEDDTAGNYSIFSEALTL